MRVPKDLRVDVRMAWEDPDSVHHLCLVVAKEQMAQRSGCAEIPLRVQLKTSFQIGLARGEAKTPEYFFEKLRKLRLPL